MGAGKYRVDGSKKVKLSDFSTDSKKDDVNKSDIKAKQAENIEKIALLQEKLYAEGKEGLIIVLQAMDAAGKDGAVKHVMSGINPQGIDVVSFKQPNSEELAHDFLWRINRKLPERGKIGLFNRSYYEDVLVVRVHELNKGYKMADRITKLDSKEFFKKRYKHIRDYEEYLYDNSYRIVKIFLNVSKKEQKKRFLERLENPDKNWKFSSSDLAERKLWKDYQDVYEQAINETASKECPWYVLPADDKWYTRYLVSSIILDALKDIDPQFPELPDSEKAKLKEYHESLMKEGK
jgi:PPK2 family polyphosphate:nucleotide phosphotransferase